MNAISVLGIITYCAAAILAAYAMLRSHQSPLPHSRRDAAAWAIVVLVFLLAALARYFAVEDAIRADLRAYLIQKGDYAGRRHIQSWLTGILLVLATIIGAWLWRYRATETRLTRRRWTVFAAIAATLAMILLFALRVISLHAIDRLLYGGPIHPNWIIEAGLCTIVAVAAVLHGWKSGSSASHGRKAL